MKVSKAELDARGKELKRTLDTLADLADKLEKDLAETVESEDARLIQKMQELRSQMNAVDQSWQSLLAATGAETRAPDITEGERLGFSDFLNSIGTAMLETQSFLDGRSLEYLRKNSHNPHVLPSIFRMPKLSAEMKFALEKQSEKEVNLIFFKNQNMAKELHQQSIKFELVSAPPPADAFAALQAAPREPALAPPSDAAVANPSVRLLLEASERMHVLDAGFAARGEHALPADAERERIVILGVEPSKGFIVLYAEPKGRNNIGVWLYSEGKFRGIYKFDKANDAAETYLRAFISKLAEEQQAYIATH